MVKIRAQALSEHDRKVTLAFDGMTLKTALSYSKEKGIVLGFEDLGPCGKTFNVANEAEVIMVRGVSLKMKADQRFRIFSEFVDSWTFTVAPPDQKIRSKLPFHRGWKLCLSSMKSLANDLLVR